MSACEQEYEITVTAVGLDEAAEYRLFDRVATAAHALNEQVACFGAPRPSAHAEQEGECDG